MVPSTLPNDPVDDEIIMFTFEIVCHRAKNQPSPSIFDDDGLEALRPYIEQEVLMLLRSYFAKTIKRVRLVIRKYGR